MFKFTQGEREQQDGRADLPTIAGSLVGEARCHLRAIFEHTKKNQAVLLIGEPDAIVNPIIIGATEVRFDI